MQNGLVFFFLFSFVLFSSPWTKTAVKPLNSKRKSWRKNSEKLWKSVKMCGKVPKKSVKKSRDDFALSCCPLVFLCWFLRKMYSFEGLIIWLACSMRFVGRQFGWLLWDSVEIAQNGRRTKCTEHTSTKIRPSKILELYIFQNFCFVTSPFPSSVPI